MNDFTPISGLIGGLLIGLSTVGLLYFNGRITGISGFIGICLRGVNGKELWRFLFLFGMVAGALIYRAATGWGNNIVIAASWPAVMAGGLLVGFGTRLGGGCTSGHGICGNARLSKRSIAATVMFFISAMLTVWLVRCVSGFGAGGGL